MSASVAFGILKHQAFTISAPFGQIELVVRDDTVSQVLLHPQSSPQQASVDSVFETAPDLLADLHHYLENPRWVFRWQPPSCGTSFQKRVWSLLKTIPSGEVRTYGDLARSLGTGSRAVASACRANPFPLVIPCHRVVSRSGMGGFCGCAEGDYVAIKAWLLTHEGLS